MSDAPVLLDVSEIESSVLSLREANKETSVPEGPARSFSLINPTSTAVSSWIDYATNPEARWHTGFHRLDVMTRGLGRGELALFMGRSHMGKSQVVFNACVHSLLNVDDARIILFSPDEPRELIVAKLYSLMFGVNSADVEQRMREGDPALVEHLKELAEPGNYLDKVLIYDGSPSFQTMHEVVLEAEQYWQMPATLAVCDYLELFGGAGAVDSQGVIAKAQGMKIFAKEADIPVVLIHQQGRSGAVGEAAGLYSSRFGGEQEAIFAYEVYRQRDRDFLSPSERRFHENSININLVKNKRGNLRGDLTYYLDPDTGRITEYTTDLVPEADEF
tara:strand:+ start:1379 stop:2374 length:996 start_codon:yes stop_codon:yes gene_type:complete